MEPGQAKRILIVEDDAACASSLKRLFESEGYDVMTALSGTRGLSSAAEFSPDLVVLDLKLPDIHGYQVCQEIRKFSNPWTLPILMLTGMDKPIDQLRGFSYGADAYLIKPCPSEELLRTVRLLLGGLAVS